MDSSRKSAISPAQLADTYPLLKNCQYLESIKAKSCRIRNFAAKLNCEVFTREERMKSNVNGGQKKPKLDPKKVEAIRNATFIGYPIEIRKQDGVWKDCIKAIDSMNRKLKGYEDSD